MPVLLCNVLPNVTDTSHGAWRRLVSVNFPTLFTADKITKPCEKVCDPDIDTKLKQCADAFLTYLLTQSHELRTKKSTLTIPTSVTQTTSAYQVESDFYKDYFNERIVKTDLVSDRLQWTDVWVDFYHWFRRSHGIEHQPKKVEVRKRFESELFKQKLNKGEWIGFLMPSHCTAGR